MKWKDFLHKWPLWGESISDEWNFDVSFGVLDWTYSVWCARLTNSWVVGGLKHHNGHVASLKYRRCDVSIRVTNIWKQTFGMWIQQLKTFILKWSLDCVSNTLMAEQNPRPGCMISDICYVNIQCPISCLLHSSTHPFLDQNMLYAQAC